MKLCTKQGNGVCLNCRRTTTNEKGEVCRYEAEILLECLREIVLTEWTQEQSEIFADFGIFKGSNDTE